MALIVILSVFNGFDSIVKALYNSFDPELKITVVEGKTFDPADHAFEQVYAHPGVAHFTEVLEDFDAISVTS